MSMLQFRQMGIVLLVVNKKPTRHIKLLIYSMKHTSALEANRFAASQEIPSIFCNPRVQYSIPTCPSPVLVLGQLYPVHAPTFHFLKIQLTIILPSPPLSSKWLPSFKFPLNTPLLSHICATWLAKSHSSQFNPRTISGEENRSWSKCGFLHSPFTSSLLGPNTIQSLTNTASVSC
jgi:hypothetical protein